MWQFLEFLENSGFSVMIRETPSVLYYPTVLAFHAFGMAALVGLSSLIALRVLGFASGLPLAPLEKFYRFINIGFWVNLASGLVLLVLSPTTFLVMPLFYIKLVAIAGALVLVRKLRTSLFDRHAGDNAPVSSEARLLAGSMLFLWAVAIQAGRLTAYSFFPIGWQTIIATTIAVVLVLVALRIGHRSGAEEKPAQQSKVRTSTGY